jgi:hypothetical protein
LLRGPSEDVGHDSLYFELITTFFRESMMRISGLFPSVLVTAEELSLGFVGDQVVEVILWREFLMLFPSVKALRIYGDDNCGIASAPHQDHIGRKPTFLPALEEIELCMGSHLNPEGRASVLATFDPFVSARQKVGLTVKVEANHLIRSL